MNLGFISRKIGLGDKELLKGYSSIKELISTEVEKPVDFVGAETILGSSGIPEVISFNKVKKISMGTVFPLLPVIKVRNIQT